MNFLVKTIQCAVRGLIGASIQFKALFTAGITVSDGINKAEFKRPQLLLSVLVIGYFNIGE